MSHEAERRRVFVPRLPDAHPRTGRGGGTLRELRALVNNNQAPAREELPQGISSHGQVFPVAMTRAMMRRAS